MMTCEKCHRGRYFPDPLDGGFICLQCGHTQGMPLPGVFREPDIRAACWSCGKLFADQKGAHAHEKTCGVGFGSRGRAITLEPRRMWHD